MKSSITRQLQRHRFLLFFICGLVFFRTSIADWSPVPSGSMEPTLYPGDVLWIDKLSYGPTLPLLNRQLLTWGHPQRGDVITFVPPHVDQLYVKRVIAVPGDRIRIEGLTVYINGERLPQRLVEKRRETMLGEEWLDGHRHAFQLSAGRGVPFIGRTIEVPPGKYFVMGDHRNNSADSRYWGFVDETRIMGKVERIALSFSPKRGLLERFALPVL